eukprot:Protomagalhaensia_wolfi_Nauph_80__2547@NODE_2705_length_1011_cov_222_226337_g1990_i1_p1_GENE_NODE_2705_length_1011_cov_222_226337_g1990_i1NODE_2705_length_1011_cov_222_226337_g1990_i1_p1_ORF_typecomplete_len193_score17_76_NODE_2705_length_1011_cov_222_226337_g1990_i1328906
MPTGSAQLIPDCWSDTFCVSSFREHKERPAGQYYDPTELQAAAQELSQRSFSEPAKRLRFAPEGPSYIPTPVWQTSNQAPTPPCQGNPLPTLWQTQLPPQVYSGSPVWQPIHSPALLKAVPKLHCHAQPASPPCYYFLPEFRPLPNGNAVVATSQRQPVRCCLNAVSIDRPRKTRPPPTLCSQLARMFGFTC